MELAERGDTEKHGFRAKLAPPCEAMGDGGDCGLVILHQLAQQAGDKRLVGIDQIPGVDSVVEQVAVHFAHTARVAPNLNRTKVYNQSLQGACAVVKWGGQYARARSQIGTVNVPERDQQVFKP